MVTSTQRGIVTGVAIKLIDDEDSGWIVSFSTSEQSVTTTTVLFSAMTAFQKIVPETPRLRFEAEEGAESK